MEDQSPQKVVAVFYEKWLLIRGANYDALTGINLYFVVVAVLFVCWFFLVSCFEQNVSCCFPQGVSDFPDFQCDRRKSGLA